MQRPARARHWRIVNTERGAAVDVDSPTTDKASDNHVDDYRIQHDDNSRGRTDRLDVRT